MTVLFPCIFLGSGPDVSCLVRINGIEAGRRYDLGDGPTTLGSDVMCDIRVEDPSGAPLQAVMRNLESEIHVESVAGALLRNDEAISTAKLRHGDFLQIGPAVFRHFRGSNIDGLVKEVCRQISIRDPETQAFNHEYFFEALERELFFSRRYKRSLALVILPVEPALDADALSELAEGIHARLRRIDLLARLTADAFVVLAPSVDLVDAEALAAELRLVTAFEPKLVVLDQVTEPFEIVRARIERLLQPDG